MIEYQSIVSFTLLALLFNAAPGPSVFLVSSIGAVKGKFAAVMTALGLSTGSAMHALLAGFGLTAVFSADKRLGILVAFTGGCYVIYLGVSSLYNKASQDHLEDSNLKKSPFLYYRQGVLVEFLNPKTILFYTSILSGLMASGVYSREQAVLIALIVPATALPIDLFFGLGGGYLNRLHKDKKLDFRWFNQVSAFSLMCVGMYLLWQSAFSPLADIILS